MTGPIGPDSPDYRQRSYGRA